MVTAAIDGVPVQPDLNGQRAIDIYRLLHAPDGLADLLSAGDCAAAAQVVDCLAAHLRSARKIDAIGIIDQLALLFTDDDRLGQSSIRCLSPSVAKFVADCMKFVDDDDTEFIVVEFVSTVPLVCGYHFLCAAGTVPGFGRPKPALQRTGARRYVPNAEPVVYGIEIWRHRAKRAIASGHVIAEEDLFLLLDGLARFGVGAGR